MSQTHQAKIAAAGLKAAFRSRYSLSPFDHAHHRFHLASLGVFRIVERLPHLPSVSAAGHSYPGPAVLRWHMACNSDDLTGEFVIRLRIVAGVRYDIVDSCLLRGFPDKASEFVHVGPRTVASRIGQNHVGNEHWK